MMSNPLCEQPGPPQAQCLSCVWYFEGGRGPAVSRCRRYGGARIEPDWPACVAHTADLDCLACGACCREAYHAVEVGPRDPFVRAHPERVVSQDGRLNVAREGKICGCLAPKPGAWPCVVYDDRPKTCRDFERGQANCVDARVRLGITP
jgi:hypothetical protein